MNVKQDLGGKIEQVIIFTLHENLHSGEKQQYFYILITFHTNFPLNELFKH